MKSPRRLLLALLPALVTGMGHPTAHAQAPQPVRVGFICPFTGGSADFGLAARMGAELAVKEINEVGGFMGRPLELVARDDQSNPAVGRQAAEELVGGKKADFTIGFCNTGVALNALEVFQNARHLLLIPVATGTALTAKYPAASSLVFRLSVRDAVQAAFLVDEVVKRGLSRVAVFADKTGYGEGGLNDVTRLLAEKGLQPAYVARFDLGTASLSAQMKEAKAAGVDAVISYTVGPEQAVVARARADAGLNAPLMGPWTLSLRAVGEKAGSAVEGALMPQTIIQDVAMERRTSFIARLRRQAGGQSVGSLMAAAQTYDAFYLMLGALFQTRGRTDGDTLKAALEQLDRPYPGVVTTYERPFSSSDHDAVSRNMVWLGTWRKGDIHFAYPEDAKRAAVMQRKAP